MPGERAYKSELREAQAAMTRERILTAARDFLERERLESLTLRRIALLSGVSAPTVYAHFPTMDDLVEAFFFWVKPRLKLDQPLPPLRELSRMPDRQFPLYEEYGALLRNLMNQPSWDRQRYADRDARHGAWIAALRSGFPDLPDEQLRLGASAIASCWTPVHWRWLRDVCRFSAEEARRTAAWSIDALVAALHNNPAGLDPAAPVPPQQRLSS